jgi:hypothetical protein
MQYEHLTTTNDKGAIVPRTIIYFAAGEETKQHNARAYAAKYYETFPVEDPNALGVHNAMLNPLNIVYMAVTDPSRHRKETQFLPPGMTPDDMELPTEIRREEGADVAEPLDIMEAPASAEL